MGVTCDDLLSSIKNRSFLPISQSTLEDSDLLALSFEVARNYVAPMILSSREDFFLAYKDTAITSGQELYSLPERAMGNSLKSLHVVNSSGEFERKLDRTEVERRVSWQKTGKPYAFYLQGDDVVLVPRPNLTEDYLRQYFFKRLNELVLVSDCAKISSVATDSDSQVFTVDTDLTSSLSAGDQVDFLNAQSPFKLWAEDVEIEAITSTTITVATASVVNGAGVVTPGANDYICPRLKSCIPQFPEEWHSVLAQATVCTILGSSLGDSKKYQLALNELSKLEGGAMKTIGNRVETSPKKINSRNSILRSLSGAYLG